MLAFIAGAINNGAVIEGMCLQCYADVSPTSFFDDDEENVFPCHFGDVNIKIKFLDNIADIFGKAVEIISEISFYIVRVIKEFFKSEFADVVESFS